MAQQPIHQAVLSRRAATREQVWPIIRSFDGCFFAFKQLLWETDMHETSVRAYLQLLIKAGFIEQSGYRYRLVKDNGIEAPRINSQGEVVTASSKSEAIWRSARILGEFDTRDIMTALTALEIPVSPAYVSDYLINLHKAGYIATIKESQPGKKARYRFVASRYSGPKPPKVQRSTAIFDANLQKVVWQSGLMDTDVEDMA